MDKAWKQQLLDEAGALGIGLDSAQIELLSAHVDLMLKWNGKVNLTRITAPDEVRLKHVVDSLAALAAVPESAATALDLGTGAGFPGIPWLIARRGLRVTMVDSVAKKISFLKTAVAQLKLKNGRAVHVRLEGDPDREGLARVDVVVSRAFTNLGDFLGLARAYLTPGGSAVAMLGRREGEASAREIVERMGFQLAASVPVVLPGGMGDRLIVRAVPRETT